MKLSDPLALAWQTTISRKGDDAAVFDATGSVARSFRDIEGHARAFEAKMDKLLPGAVVAVQIGNHEDWSAVFIACLRKQLVVLPLDQSIGEQQRNAALEVCKASVLVSALSGENSPQIIRLRTADTTVQGDEVFNAWKAGPNAVDHSEIVAVYADHSRTTMIDQVNEVVGRQAIV